MRTALLFPGQGAPATDWREATARLRPDLIEAARRGLGADPFDHLGAGTEWDQPAIYCASLAAFGLAPADAEVHAGHSLGELAALACAGALSDLDGLTAVIARGRLMAAAAAASGAGAMLAVGAPAAELTVICERLGLAIANLNSAEQTVLSGPAERVDEATALLRERRTRAKRLRVSGAFHSAEMRPAAAKFRAVLDGIDVRAPAVPVLSGRSARPFSDVRAELAAAIVDPVRWIDVVAALRERGIERCVEVGPGRALGNIIKRSGGEISVERLAATERTHA